MRKQNKLNKNKREKKEKKKEQTTTLQPKRRTPFNKNTIIHRKHRQTQRNHLYLALSVNELLQQGARDPFFNETCTLE